MNYKWKKRVWISSKMGPSTKKGSSIRIRCRVSAILFSISCSFCMYCVQNTCQITHASAKNQIIWMLQQQPKQKQAENIHTEQSIIQMRICFSWRYPISGNLVGKRASKQVTNNALLPHFHEFISTYNFFSCVCVSVAFIQKLEVKLDTWREVKFRYSLLLQPFRASHVWCMYIDLSPRLLRYPVSSPVYLTKWSYLSIDEFPIHSTSVSGKIFRVLVYSPGFSFIPPALHCWTKLNFRFCTLSHRHSALYTLQGRITWIRMVTSLLLFYNKVECCHLLFIIQQKRSS